MSGVNLVSSAFDAVLPAFVIPNPKGGAAVLGLVSSFSGIAMVIGWVLVPVMSANYDVVFRNSVPVELQGRVYACRNALQFFRIPIGLFLGGFLVDEVCEPFMRLWSNNECLTFLFGQGKGSGAALTLFILGITGVVYCLIMGAKMKQYKYHDD